jgi:predicted enzyme related to lactoylglutathione lyase
MDAPVSEEAVTMKLEAVNLFVADVTAALDFYHRAFGFETRHHDAEYDYGELDTGGTMLTLASHRLGAMVLPAGYTRSDPGSPPWGVYLAFLTADVPAAFAQAVAAGAVAVQEPKRMPWGQTVAHVRDPEGTLIELCSPIG